MTCIISPFYKDRGGYAIKWYNGKNNRHHRLTYALHNNIDPDDMKNLVVMHTCDNPPCINPDHLRLGTHQDNMTDKINKKRHKTKLTEQQVLDIRASNKSGVELGNEYGVTKATISDIRLRKIWRHI